MNSENFHTELYNKLFFGAMGFRTEKLIVGEIALQTRAAGLVAAVSTVFLSIASFPPPMQRPSMQINFVFLHDDKERRWVTDSF